MNQINPWMKAWANAEKTQMSAARGKAKWKRKLKDGHEFLEGSHRYERTFSDQGVGEFKVMNGRDAKELNDHLFATFLKAVDKNIKGRSLERWKVVEKFVKAEALAS
jgi:hypothetical protein